MSSLPRVSPSRKRTAVSAREDGLKLGPVSTFIEHHFRHFNAATLVDAAKAYRRHLEAAAA